MSLTALGLLSGSSGNVNQLASQLAASIDTNHDSQISIDEFAGFLTQVLDELNATSPSSTQSSSSDPSSSSASSTSGSAVSLDGEVAPNQWTDNNAPYGVTFAGFSPQNHTDLALADLKLAKNAKYAAYDYLLSNKIAPDATWAPTAADALNKQTGSTLFHAIDGETLGYGDEYIHSAPNGRGMPSGTYNPTAVGEFLWGADPSLA